jgi:hypothetical protein
MSTAGVLAVPLGAGIAALGADGVADSTVLFAVAEGVGDAAAAVALACAGTASDPPPPQAVRPRPSSKASAAVAGKEALFMLSMLPRIQGG